METTDVPIWKLLATVRKARRTWQRLPPEKRKQLVESAGRQAKTYGPIVAKRLRKVIDDFNKPVK